MFPVKEEKVPSKGEKTYPFLQMQNNHHQQEPQSQTTWEDNHLI